MQHSSAGPSSLIALEVAEAFSNAIRAGSKQRDDHMMAAMCIGTHVADLGEPGNWEAIQPKQLLDCMVGEDIERFCFDTLWMYLFLEFQDLVSARAVVRLIDGFATHGPKTKRFTVMLHDAIKLLRAQNPGSAAIPADGLAARGPRSRLRKFR